MLKLFDLHKAGEQKPACAKLLPSLRAMGVLLGTLCLLAVSGTVPSLALAQRGTNRDVVPTQQEANRGMAPAQQEANGVMAPAQHGANLVMVRAQQGANGDVVSTQQGAAGGMAPAQPKATGGMVPVHEPLPVSRLQVEIRETAWDTSEFAQMAEDLILLREGDPFSPERLQDSVEALKLCNRFREVRVETREEREGIAIRFFLSPAPRIKNIEVKGEFPFLEQEILEQMATSAGDILDEAALPGDEALVREFCGREGYPDAEVGITARQDPEDGYYVLIVRIEKGGCSRLQGLQIQGNRAFSEVRLKLAMNTWRRSLLPGGAGCFTEAELAKDVRELTRFYWKNGYPEALISSRVSNGPGGALARVVLTVEEGPRYKVSTAGTGLLWRIRHKKKDVVLAARGNRNESGLRRSVRNLQNRYRAAGYLQAAVQVDDQRESTAKGEVRRLRLALEKGPRARVETLQVSGNSAFSDGKVRKQMLTREGGWFSKGAYVPSVLEDDLSAVQALYLREGYLAAEIDPEVTREADGETERVSIGLRIREGPRTEVSSVEVSGAEVLSPAEISRAVGLQVGKPYRGFLLPLDQNSLAALISEKGYPLAEVKGHAEISEDRKRAEVSLQVQQGPYLEMGQAYCAGNVRTREKVFTRELQMKPGDPFSLKKMYEGQRNIRDLEILNAVRFRTFGLKEGADKVTLFIEAEEKKPYYLELGGGYETQKGLFGLGRAGDRNLLGLNRDAWVFGEVSQIGYRGEGRVTDPRFLGRRITATFRPFVERKAEFNRRFGTMSYGASLGFSREWLRNLRTGLDLSYERRDQFTQNGGSTGSLQPAPAGSDEEQFEPRNVLIVTPSVRYDGRDSFIRPRKGFYSEFAVDLSKGLGDALDSFLKYRLDLRFYWSPYSRLTLAWHGKAGVIDPFGREQTIPYDQLFFLGGTLDVRGFRENLFLRDIGGKAVGGRTSLLGSMEARVDLIYNFEFAAFFDVGWLGDTFDSAAGERLGTSTGFGLRYNTPIGPIGVLYGINLDRRPGEDFGRLHFAIGYTF